MTRALQYANRVWLFAASPDSTKLEVPVQPMPTQPLTWLATSYTLPRPFHTGGEIGGFSAGAKL